MTANNLRWFVTFSTYDRRRVFASPEIRQRCSEALREACERNGYRAYALAIMPDHVHLVLDAGASDHSLPKVMNNLKGVSARRVFQHHADLKLDLRSEHLWTSGYFDRLLRDPETLRSACQ